VHTDSSTAKNAIASADTSLPNAVYESIDKAILRSYDNFMYNGKLHTCTFLPFEERNIGCGTSVH